MRRNHASDNKETHANYSLSQKKYIRRSDIFFLIVLLYTFIIFIKIY